MIALDRIQEQERWVGGHWVFDAWAMCLDCKGAIHMEFKFSKELWAQPPQEDVIREEMRERIEQRHDCPKRLVVVPAGVLH